jgi:hypothetical protein
MRWSRRVTMVVAAMVVTILGSSSQATAAPTIVRFVSFNGWGACLSVGGASLANGAPVVQWHCFDSSYPPEREWYWSGKRIINFLSGKRLAIGDRSTARGARAIQWTCNGGSEQNWSKISVGPGEGWLIRNENSGLYLSVAEGSYADGAWVVQWSGNNSPEQHWSENH